MMKTRSIQYQEGIIRRAYLLVILKIKSKGVSTLITHVLTKSGCNLQIQILFLFSSLSFRILRKNI